MSDPRTETQTDAPTPPGGPQRQDAAGPGLVAGDKGLGETAADSVEDEHGGTIPIDQEQPGGSTDDEAEDSLQEENAETSLDQPSQ